MKFVIVMSAAMLSLSACHPAKPVVVTNTTAGDNVTYTPAPMMTDNSADCVRTNTKDDNGKNVQGPCQ